MSAPTATLASPADLRALQLLADGLTKRQIGIRLGCSESAAKQRLLRLYRRLGVQNAPQAVAVGFRTGLLQIEVAS